MPTDEDSDRAVPGYKNYLVYSDESGQSGKVYYGFGSLWMPWQRRGDFSALVNELRNKHSYRHEIKWNKVARATVPLCRDLVEEFFKRPWLMFHCLIVRKGYVDKSYHEDYDEAMRKHFAKLISSKIAYFSNSKQKKMYHVNVDPLPSRYKKADEAAQVIINNTLKKELGLAPVHRLTTRDSKENPGHSDCRPSAGRCHGRLEPRRARRAQIASKGLDRGTSWMAAFIGRHAPLGVEV